MSITLKTMVHDGLGTEAKIIWIDHQEDYALFQELVQRAVNLWPDAPAKIKSFADVVTVGKVQQEYVDDPVKFTYPKEFTHGTLSESTCSHENTRSVDSRYGTLYCLKCKGIFSLRSKNIVYHSKVI